MSDTQTSETEVSQDVEAPKSLQAQFSTYVANDDVPDSGRMVEQHLGTPTTGAPEASAEQE